MTKTTSSPDPIVSQSLQPLLDQAVRFSFFEALRVIENASLDLPRVGHASSPSQERFRIRQPADLSFAPSTIDRAQREIDSNVASSEHRVAREKIAIDQRFFGLLGPSGPLPIHLTEVVRNRDRHANDDALQAFLDIFHHRMASIFFRAWSSSRASIQRDRPDQDRFAQYLRSLSGNGWKRPTVNEGFGPEFTAFFAGHLGSLRRNAEGLEAILSSISRTQVQVRPFALRWLRLAQPEQTQLTSSPRNKKNAFGSNCLGRTAVIGERVPDRQGSFEVRLGPMSFEQFQKLLPDSSTQKGLRSALLSHSGLGTNAVLRAILKKDDVPPTLLGRMGQLGRTAWIQSKPIESDRDDFAFQLSRHGSLREDLPRGDRSTGTRS